jgi:hypothetical protein
MLSILIYNIEFQAYCVCSGLDVWLAELGQEQLDQVLLAEIDLGLGWLNAWGRQHWSGHFEYGSAAHEHVWRKHVLGHLVDSLLLGSLSLKLGSLVLGDLCSLLLKHCVLSDQSLDQGLLLVEVI